MKTLSIARKTLIELWREPLLLLLLLLFPAAMVGFYYVAFAQTEGGLSTYLTILVANKDTGTTLEDGTHWQAGADLVQVLTMAEWDGQPVFDVQIVADPRAANIALREGKASLLLSIPPDFTQTLARVAQGGGGSSPATLTLTGDPGSDSYVFALSFLNGLLRQYSRQIAGWQDDTVTINYEFLPGTGTMSDFEFGVGGIIVFGIMFLIITTATVLVRETAWGTLQRLRLTLAGAGALLLGVTLAQMVAAIVQIPITFGTALVLGFHSNGSLLLSMGIGLLLTLSAVGLGLIVACFARSDGEAASLASGVMVPMVFLSGALYPMPELALFTIGDRTVQVYDLLPATHASEALRKVLIFGQSPMDITYELVALTVLSVITLVIGIALYQRLRLRTQT